MRTINNIEQDLFETAGALSPARFKELAVEWAGAVAGVVGVDNSKYKGPLNEDYRARLQPYVEKINARLGVAHTKGILNELSEAVQAQLAIATYLEKAATSTQQNNDTKLFAGNRTSEREWIGDHLGLIEYLKQPVTQITVTDFIASQKNQFPPEHAENFHREFWSQPFSGRVSFIQTVLEDNRHGGYRKALNATKEHQIIKDFLPSDGGPDSAFQIGKIITNAFAWTAPSDLGAEAITAMIGAVHEDRLDQQSPQPRTLDGAERFGYRLGSFMNSLGPGASKVAQYGHSLPTANDAWMPGLAKSKTEAGRANRVDFLRWVDASVTEDVKRNIDRIGSYKGTGAWIETYGVDLNPAYRLSNPIYRAAAAGDDLVLSILKPDARAYGLKFIDYLLRLGQMAKTASPAAQRSVAPLLEIVDQGRRMVEQETDLRNSAPQEKLAADYFDKVSLAVGKMQFKFFTQGVFDFAEKFRISLEVKGPHFNQVPELTDAQRLYKRQTAIALFVAAANMCLSGRPFNHDIHGDNEGLQVKDGAVTVGMFDNGALDVHAPTTAQKHMLADCLFNALANTARNKYGPASSLKHTIAKTSEAIGADRQSELDYANAVLRAFLSIGDYTRHMRKRDFVVAGIAILKGGDIDREVTTRFRYRAKALAATLFLPAQLSNGFTSEREQRSQFYPRNPKPKRVQQMPRTLTEKPRSFRRRPPSGWLTVRLNVGKRILSSLG